MILDKYGAPTDPPEETIVANDWKGEPIFSGDPDKYFNTDDGYVLNDPYELESYFKHVWGHPQHVSEEI